MNCNKCGNILKETDKLVWKCISCRKAYGVTLSYLHKLIEIKNDKNVISVLKCKECGKYLDNGDEKIFWKCTCGNVQCGTLDDYREIDVTPNNTQIKHEDKINKKKKIKLKVKYILPISLLCILISGGAFAFNSARKNQKYKIAENAYKNTNYELAEELFSSLGDFKNSELMLRKTKLKKEEPKDKNAPVIENVPKYIKLYAGEKIDYNNWIKKNGIKAIDDIDGEVAIVVNDANVDYDIANEDKEITISATDKAGNITIKNVKISICNYPTYDAYLSAASINEFSLEQDKIGSCYYNGIHINDNEINHLEHGTVYRSLATQLEGFYMLGKPLYPNWGKNTSVKVFGFQKKKTWKKMKPFIDKVLPFINSEYPIGEILFRFNKLNCAKGKFDFKNGNFNFTINNLTKAAHQLGVSEEMLGYILAYIDEYGGESSFKKNKYSIKMHFYRNNKLEKSDFKYYKNFTTKRNIFNKIDLKEYLYFATNLNKNRSIPSNMSTLDANGYATYRGIKLSHSQNAVILLYGNGEKHQFDKNSDILYKSLKWNGDLSYNYLEDCKEYIFYKYQGNELVFYFNKNKKVIMVMYSRWLPY